MIIHGEYVVRRGLRILLLPVLAVIFLFGWVLYVVGVPRGNAKKKSSEITRHNVPSDVVEDGLEIGVVEEITEEPQTVS